MHYQSIVGCNHFFPPLCAKVWKIDIGGLQWIYKQALLLCNDIGSFVCSATVDQALLFASNSVYLHFSIVCLLCFLHLQSIMTEANFVTVTLLDVVGIWIEIAMVTLQMGSSIPEVFNKWSVYFFPVYFCCTALALPSLFFNSHAHHL